MSCATQQSEISGNEKEFRTPPEKFWKLHCWNIHGRRDARPFLVLTVQGKRRVAALDFPSEQRDYLDFEIPFENERYGPFPGEEILEWSSPYKGASDYKITDGFHLILPELTRAIGELSMGHDRDSSRKNGYVEIKPRNHGIRTSVDLHCEAD